MRKYFSEFWNLLVKSFIRFDRSNGLKLSAALSYYTVFSVCPCLIIIISLAGVFINRENVEGKVFRQISGMVGRDTATQIQDIILKTQHANIGTIGGIFGAIFLLIGATGVFSEIQSSINFIWSIPPAKKKVFLIAVIRKLISLSLLIAVSFLLMVSLTANALIDLLRNRLKEYFSDSSINLFYYLNMGLIIVVIGFMFTIILKILPHSTLSWKHAFIGALITSLLFLLGKSIIGFYLGHSKVGATFGATASIVILMLWIYYSSIILYFGASFTAEYASSKGKPIKSR